MLFLEIGIAIIIVSLISLVIASHSHHRRVEHYIKKELVIEDNLKKKVSGILEKMGFEGVTVAGVTLFDVLYNIVKMNPESLSGIAHLHHAQNFSNLGDVVEYVREHIISDVKEGSQEWQDIIHKYKGYTGEQIAFEHLKDAGHTVEIPESGTQEGYDAIVDGHPVNIKITDDPSYIQHHLDAHPDIPVYTNYEIAHSFGDNDHVIIDHDLSLHDVFHKTADTFEGIKKLKDFIGDIPVITLTISSLRNAAGVIEGKKDVKTAAEHVALDTAGVGIGGKIGAGIGLKIGLSLAPVTGGVSAIVVPLATTAMSVIGIMTGKRIVRWFKERHLRKAKKRLEEIAAVFRDTFVFKFDVIVGKIEKFFDDKIQVIEGKYKESEGFFKRVFFPSVFSKFCQMAMKELRKEREQIVESYNNLLKQVSRAKPGEGGLILYAQGTNVLGNDEELLGLYKDVEAAILKVEEERRKLE